MWMFWSFLKAYMSFSVHMVILTSIVYFLLVGYMKSSQKKTTVWCQVTSHFSGRISVISYTVSVGLMEAKVNQVKPCFNII